MAKKTTKKDETEMASGAPKLFDVAQPGKTAASATSRPIIVNHGSMIKQDPMVKDEAVAGPTKSGDIAPPSQSKKAKEVVQPSVENDEKPPTEEVKKPEKEEAVTPEPKDAENTDSTTAPDASSETGSEVATELANKIASNKEEKAKAEEQSKKVEELNKLIDSKKYFVQIHQGPTSRNLSSWILVILLLATIGVVLAIDAEVLNVGLLLPFDLIKK